MTQCRATNWEIGNVKTIVIAYRIRDTLIAILSSLKFSRILSWTMSRKYIYPVTDKIRDSTNAVPTDIRLTDFHRDEFELDKELYIIKAQSWDINAYDMVPIAWKKS